MLPELTREELSAALDEVAAGAIEAGGLSRPPVDALTLAAQRGIQVAFDDRQAGRARIVRLRGQLGRAERSSILLRPDPRPERLQWAAAHELGEELASAVFALLGAEPNETAGEREKIANHLASRLLLPTRWFVADAEDCGWDLLTLKRRYNTASHELIARRMLDCAPPVLITIFDNGRQATRLGNLPGIRPKLQPIEKACWDRVRESALPQATKDRLVTVQGWPIHEPDWKREVLRTLVHAEDSICE